MSSRFTVYGTMHKNKDWMTTLDAQGYGPMIETDISHLMKKNGFTVTESTTFEYEGKLTPTFIEKGKCSKLLYSSITDNLVLISH